MKMRNLSRRVLLSIGCILMISAVGLALAVPPIITSNTVHVLFGVTYLPTLKVVNEGSQESMMLTASKTTTTIPPYGVFTPIAGPSGTLTYNYIGPTFDVSFTETDGLLSLTTGYSLIYYIDNPGWVGSGTIIVLASGTSDGFGNLAIGTPAAPVVTPIATDLPAPTDGNVLMGAKIWLVPTSDVSGSTLTWASYPASYEFETALVNYHMQSITPLTVDLWATVPTPASATMATLATQNPLVTAFFWYSTDGKVTWNPIAPSIGVPITWGWYCGSTATTVVSYTGTAGQDVDFGVSVTPTGTVTVITPPYSGQTNP